MVPPPPRPTWWRRAVQSAWASAQQKPASSRATATATIVRRLPRCVVEAAPEAVQAPLRLPGDRAALGGLAVLAALERLAPRPGSCGSARRPRPAAGGRAWSRLGDRALAAGLAARVLGGHEPEVAHQLPARCEAGEVADLGAQPDRGERVDPAQAAQPGDGLRPTASRARARRSCASSVVAADARARRSRRGSQQRHLRAALAEIDARQPRAVRCVHVAAVSSKRTLVAQQQLATAGGGRASDRRARPRARGRGRAAPPPRRVGTLTGCSPSIINKPQHPLGVAPVGDGCVPKLL